jgi:hypothetical protein
LARNSAQRLARLGWQAFHRTHFHHYYKSLSPSIATVPHPAAGFLTTIARNGVPALSQTKPWTVYQQDEAIRRGPHVSAARLYDHFILEDIYDYVNMGYWLVLPYRSLQGHPRLRIAPSGVVPQRESWITALTLSIKMPYLWHRTAPCNLDMHSNAYYNALPIAVACKNRYGRRLLPYSLKRRCQLTISSGLTY